LRDYFSCHNLYAAKAHIRNNRPVVLAICTNDGLGASAKNIGALLNVKNVFFVPFRQDDPEGKQKSLEANLDLIKPTIKKALDGQQLQPVLWLS
jgi:dipicolinate synthase subunit B